MGLFKKLTKALGMGPEPVAPEQIPKYTSACQDVIIALIGKNYASGGLLPVEQRFLAEALPAYFADCVERHKAELYEDSEMEVGYLRCQKEFWKQWDSVFLQIAKERKIKELDPLPWCRAWQQQLLILKLFSDLAHFSGVPGVHPETLYLRESELLDLPSKLREFVKQEGLEIELPGKKQ